jgi:hypothetical protein
MFSHSLLIEYLSLFQFKLTSGYKSVSRKFKLAGENLNGSTKREECAFRKICDGLTFQYFSSGIRSGSPAVP